MREIEGDIWDFHKAGFFIVIPTNGFVKNDGECVMGRGLAYEAKRRFPDLPLELGKRIREYGNVVFVFVKYRIITFPVKYNWYEKADMDLIRRSAIGLREMFRFNLIGMPTPVYLPKVGCGNGKLNWFEVRAMLEMLLNDDFIVVR